jgi:ABC-type uncharacterized transport system substrate-binding protein
VGKGSEAQKRKLDGGGSDYGSRIVAKAMHAALPVIYRSRDFADAGGLISYGTEIAAAWTEAGVYAGEILKGANPTELPVSSRPSSSWSST